MKTLFAVKYNNDESPFFCVADNEDDARYFALERLAELQYPIGGELSVASEGVYSTVEDFERLYSLRRNPYATMTELGGTLFGAAGVEWDTVRQSPPATIWTLVESDEIWWICPGIHIVNRLGYLLSNEERINDETQHLYE